MESSSLNNGSNGRVTYAEVRKVARWLHLFTRDDLADSLRISPQLADQFIKALLWQGIAVQTEDVLPGPDGDQILIEMEPLPELVYNREKRTPPHIKAVFEMFGGFELYNVRGITQRIRTERQMRRSLSTPGARQVHKNRERAYMRQKQANDQRKLQDKKKARAKAEGRSVEDLDKGGT